MDVIFLVEVEGGQTGRAVEVEASEGIVVPSGQGRIEGRLERLQAKAIDYRRRQRSQSSIASIGAATVPRGLCECAPASCSCAASGRPTAPRAATPSHLQYIIEVKYEIFKKKLSSQKSKIKDHLRLTILAASRAPQLHMQTQPGAAPSPSPISV